jgi:hypothetical protein
MTMAVFDTIATALSRTPAHAGSPPKSPRGGRPTSIRIGARYGNWTVLSYTPSRALGNGKRSEPTCSCRCDCGATRDVLAPSLTGGFSTSCGHETGGRPPKLRGGH